MLLNTSVCSEKKALSKLCDYPKVLAEYEREQEKERKKIEDAEAARAAMIKEAQVAFSLSV